MKKNEEVNKEKKGTKIYLDPGPFSETTRNKPLEKNPMKILGKLPISLNNSQITTQKDLELQVQFFEENFREHFRKLIK